MSPRPLARRPASGPARRLTFAAAALGGALFLLPEPASAQRYTGTGERISSASGLPLSRAGGGTFASRQGVRGARGILGPGFGRRGFGGFYGSGFFNRGGFIYGRGVFGPGVVFGSNGFNSFGPFPAYGFGFPYGGFGVGYGIPFGYGYTYTGLDYGNGYGITPGPHGLPLYGPVVTPATAPVAGVAGYGLGGANINALAAAGVGLGGAALNPVAPVVDARPVENLQAQALADNWRRDPLRAAPGENLGDLADGAVRRVPRDPTERELADALREERLGDEAFRNGDGTRALNHYRRAADLAPTRGESLYRRGIAELALGNYAGAGDSLRRAVAANPSLPTTGPTLRDLFGPGSDLPRLSMMSRVAEFTRADVRDPDRLFLLAVTMHANGDDRSREIFEAAWRLTGGRPHLRPFLDPVAVNFTGSGKIGEGVADPDEVTVPDDVGVTETPADAERPAGPAPVPLGPTPPPVPALP